MSVHRRETEAVANRRRFIGGSDAQIIMGDDEAALIRLWRENGAKSSRRTCPVTSSSSLGWQPKT
jgi:predicted phage-related endonuclease